MVWVLSDFCESVTDSEELVGRFNLVSRLPQYLATMLELYQNAATRMEESAVHTYLITAILTGAAVLARYTVESTIFAARKGDSLAQGFCKHFECGKSSGRGDFQDEHKFLEREVASIVLASDLAYMNRAGRVHLHHPCLIFKTITNSSCL